MPSVGPRPRARSLHVSECLAASHSHNTGFDPPGCLSTRLILVSSHPFSSSFSPCPPPSLRNQKHPAGKVRRRLSVLATAVSTIFLESLCIPTQTVFNPVQVQLCRPCTRFNQPPQHLYTVCPFAILFYTRVLVKEKSAFCFLSCHFYISASAGIDELHQTFCC